MTFSRWHVYIGLLLTLAKLLDADLLPVIRDGQKRSVYIYRFLTAGTIDGESLQRTKMMPVANVPIAEKIYQRQITKLGLSNSRFPHLVMRSEVDFFVAALIGDVRLLATPFRSLFHSDSPFVVGKVRFKV
jgi:hypothetical protein